MTTTTKYELTDADRERLDAIAQRASGKPKVTDIAWKVACDWFATLRVVSREAAERALGSMTEDEGDQFEDDYTCHNGTGQESRCHALDNLLARRRAMLDDATGGPPKVEPTPEPQPAIDVVAELAELRRLIDLMLGNARLLELQGECLDDFRRRLNALESAAQRKPRWRWW